MVASVGRITAGQGYDYLTKSVATSKHDYYTGTGEAAGQWMGRGSALLDLSGEVDADDMAALYGRFVVPSTAGNRVGPDGRILPEQILGRKVSAQYREPKPGEKVGENGKVLVSEPIAAFDVTFSPSKSVSLLWALSDSDEVRQAVLDAHEDAVATALDYLDRNAGHTRTGVGGVRRVDGEGFVVAQFRHRTARSTDPGARVGDPQLHSHCAILNRVRGGDGNWRTLDSKAIYRHAHTSGALYGATFEALLTERLGVSWLTPDERVPMREIDGIGDHLRSQFSTRRADVLATYERLEAQWFKVHGRSPTRSEKAGMLDEATTRSRHAKSGGDVDLHEQWRSEVVEADLADVNGAVGRASTVDGGRLEAGSVEMSEAVFDALHGQRAWWTRAHVYGEVARLVDDPRPEVIERETERIIADCTVLEGESDPEYAKYDETKHTSTTILDAEKRVLDATTQPAGFDVAGVRDPMLGDDQVGALQHLTAGPTRVSAVIGPAGAGKTTMLKSVAQSYEEAGRDVIVIALSAAAARVVTDETGLEAHTIASWKIGQVDMPRDALVIVDEASMVPTLLLDEMVRVSGVYRSRIALLGDYAQMGAPEAGGLLRDVAATPATVELTAVWRFKNDWEADASKRLRGRDETVAELYDQHQRIKETTAEHGFVAAANAWQADIAAGFTSLVVVDTAAQAAEVSARCQQVLFVDGKLGERVAVGADRNSIHVGDAIQTRDNNSDISTSDGRRVLNRDVWEVTGLDDGHLLAKQVGHGRTAKLPAAYVAESVELAYAVTIAGAQGRTVDTCHTTVTPKTQSASLYVAMTRGGRRNTAHVVTDGHDHDEFGLGDRTGVQGFAAASRRSPDGQLSATTVAERWAEQAPVRAAERAKDRNVRQVTDWWQQRQRRLPAAAVKALAEHHRTIIEALAKLPSDPIRSGQVMRAGGGLNWRRPDAAAQFIDRLGREHQHRGEPAPAPGAAAEPFRR